jgi:hypothetical protein
MALKIPQNQTITKYTSGGEYVIANTGVRYQGYYCEVGGKVYTGKEYDISGSLLLIKPTSENYNQLLSRPDTFIYSAISNVKINTKIPPKPIVYDPLQAIISSEPSAFITRYFVKKINGNIIKEVNKDTFNKINTDPLYQTVTVDFVFAPSAAEIPQNLNEAEKTMPGITLFLYDSNQVGNIVDFKNNNL